MASAPKGECFAKFASVRLLEDCSLGQVFASHSTMLATPNILHPVRVLGLHLHGVTQLRHLELQAGKLLLGPLCMSIVSVEAHLGQPLQHPSSSFIHVHQPQCKITLPLLQTVFVSLVPT